VINFLWLLLAFILLLCNAFFVAAEFGMVRLRATRVATIKDDYGLRGRTLFRVHQHLDAYLSACQLGITLASLGLGWVGEPAFAYLFEPVLAYLGVVSDELVTVISFLLAFSLLSFLHIVIGELMPKTLAIRQAEKISLWTVIPLRAFYWLMYPAIWLFNSCSNFLLKKLGLSVTHQDIDSYSSEEIKILLHSSHLHGELTQEEVKIIEHTLDFADLKVTELMRPREEMVMLDIKEPVESIMKTLMHYRYSRYPVYDPETQHVLGVIHVKDILPVLYMQGEIKELKSFIRPILKVSNNELALDLLRKFREGAPHFALVYNRYKNLNGFLTLDNLLQMLIGRIKDEFNLSGVADWSTQADGSLIVKGSCTLYNLEKALNCEIEAENKGIDTLSGLILHRLGTLPEEGTRLDFPEFSGIIEKVQGSRIVKVRVHPVSKK
jgi:CBS domain containing-hemolysin-like protein